MRLTDECLRGVRERNELIVSTLSGKSGIKSISGMGLMLGIELEKDVNEVISACIQKGVLPIKAKNKLRLLPALNIPMEDLKYALKVILEVSKI